MSFRQRCGRDAPRQGITLAAERPAHNGAKQTAMPQTHAHARLLNRDEFAVSDAD